MPDTSVVPEWLGSLPEWLAGIGAIVALYFARAAARAAKATNDAQNAQLAQLREAQSRQAAEARQQHATKIAFWVIITREKDGSLRASVKGQNASNQPVSQVLISCLTPFGATEDIVYGNIGSGIGPVVSNRLTAALREKLGDVEVPPLLDAGKLRVSSSFRDSTGVWWYRKYSGELREAKSQEEAERGAKDTSGL